MSLKLLIADDEDAVRCGICKYIQLHTDRFDKIYTAENGQKALDQIILYQPDILLLDVRMPLKNGLEVMREASQLGILPVTIILSGYDEFSYAQQALHYGAKDYFLKPTRSTDILNYLLSLADEISGEEKMEPDEEEKENIPLTVINAKGYIKEHYNEDISAVQIAEYTGISAGHLSYLFSQYCHCGVSEMINEIRVERACVYLKQSYLKTYEIAYKVGYHDEKYFSKVFKKIKGMSPAEYKKL